MQSDPPPKFLQEIFAPLNSLNLLSAADIRAKEEDEKKKKKQKDEV